MKNIEQITPSLQKLGLTNGEIRVYTALIELGTTSVGPLIKKAQISASKAYPILDKLMLKGLVTYVVKGRARYFQSAKPIALLDFVQKKQQELEAIKNDMQNTVKLIDKIQASAKDEEEASIFKGFGGIKTGFAQALATIPNGGKYYFFSTGYESVPYLKRFFRNVTEQLHERNITLRGLAHQQERGNFKAKHNYRVRFLPFKWPSDIGIVGNQLTILVWDEKTPVLYVLKSSLLVQSYTTFFHNLWLQATL